MAISYPLTLPGSLRIKTFTIGMEQAHSFTESEFSFKSQSALHPGGRFTAQLQLAKLTQEAGRDWVAFLTALKGRSGYFAMGDLAHPTNRGSCSTTPGSPQIIASTGTPAKGIEVTVGGMPASAVNYFKAGDYFTIQNRMYMVLFDVTAGSNGRATVDIWPALRTELTTNTTIAVSQIKTLWRLRNEVPMASWDLTNLYSVSLDLIEYL